MMNKSRLMIVVSSLMLGIIFILISMMILVFCGVIQLNRVQLVFATESRESVYSGMPLTNTGWNLVSGKLKKGHELYLSVTGTQTDVGETKNTAEVIIKDELGADVTGDYLISYRLGSLKVTPRTLWISFDSDGYEILEGCDGLATGHVITNVISISNTVKSVKISDLFGKDVTQNYQIITGTKEDFGNSMNPPIDPPGTTGGGPFSDFPIEDFLGGNSNMIPPKDLEDTVLYSLYSEGDEGASTTVYLKQKSYGAYTGQGFDEAPEYTDLFLEGFSAYYLTSAALAYNGVEASGLTIKPHVDMYVLPYYTLSEIDGSDIQMTDTYFSGDTSLPYQAVYYPFVPDPLTSIPVVESYEKAYRDFVYRNYLALDDETRTYMEEVIERENLGVDSDFATMVNRVAFYIREAMKYDLEYDKAMDESDNVAIAFMRDYQTGVCRHYAMAATLMYRALGIPARYTVGFLAETEANEWADVTADRGHAWVEVYFDGIGWVHVEVTGSSSEGGGGVGNGISGGGAGLGGAYVEFVDGNGGGGSEKPPTGEPKVTFSLADLEKMYDGQSLTVNESHLRVKGFDSFFESGYWYEVSVSGSRTEIGLSYSSIDSVQIFDADGKNVTDLFEVECKKGKLHVYNRILTVKSNDFSGVYGSYLPFTTSRVSGSLAAGHEMSVSCRANLSVGKHQNLFDVTITDKSTGENVTDHYKIVKLYGEIIITEIPITVKPVDAEKRYDGTALTVSEIEIIEGTLLEGHSVAFFTIEGSQTNVGRSDSTVSAIVIVDENFEDVTANYQIQLEVGKLRVRPS